MRKKNTQTILSTLFVVYAASFLLLLCYNLIDAFFLKSMEIIEKFRFGIALDTSISMYLKYYLAIHTAGIILLYSVFFKPDYEKNHTEQFTYFLSSSIITFIVLSIVYLLLIIITAPAINYSLQGRINLNNTAIFFKNTANEFYENENYQPAVYYYDMYLIIDGNNKEINTLREYAVEKTFYSPEQNTTDNNETEKQQNMQEGDTYSLLNKARDFFDNEDYASAHYYATLTLKLDPDNSAAKILSDEALSLLYTHKQIDPNPEKYLYEDNSYSFYELKVKGYSALESENFIEAYNIFKILSEAVPENTEIMNFYEESKTGLNTMTFFYSEIEGLHALPSTSNIIFLNNNGNSKEIILIGYMYYHGPDIYFKNIQAIRLNNSGNFISSTYSDYGKFINSYINLNYIKDNEEIIFDSNKMLLLNIDVNILPYFSMGKHTVETISLNDLFSVQDLYDEAGYNKLDIELAFILKITQPILFLILSLFCISIGWAYRARYLGRPPLITYIIMPLTPFVNAILISLIFYFHKILLGYILITAGFFFAIVALVIVEFILFIISIIAISGQRME